MSAAVRVTGLNILSPQYTRHVRRTKKARTDSVRAGARESPGAFLQKARRKPSCSVREGFAPSGIRKLGFDRSPVMNNSS